VISIGKPEFNDKEKIKELFTVSISDTFDKNNVTRLCEVTDEVEEKMRLLDNYYSSNQGEPHFLIAREELEIVGVIACFPVSNAIKQNVTECTNNDSEIGCVYIVPEHQQKGIGSLLYNEMKSYLKSIGIKKCYLSAGFVTSQKYWQMKLGEPQFVLKNMWGNGFHELVWKIII
jgi:GNAT superfamily N-acetyltransferase